MKYLLYIFIFLQTNALAQSIHYTHRTSRIKIDDGIIIVPEISGTNHLWIITPGKKVKLQVYNHRLEWQQEQVLPLKISEESDVTVLPMKNEYYLYNQSEAGNKSFLWKVDAQGSMVDESSKLKAIIRASFNDTSTVCQMLSKGEHVYVFSNIYYPDIKKIVSTVVKTDHNLTQQAIDRYAFDFDHSIEKLHKIIIEPEKNITVLKKQTTPEEGFVLDILKINLKNSRIYEAHFKSNTPFSFPEIVFNSSDSTTTVYSQMTRSYTRDNVIRHMFLATLNDTLGEKTKATVLRFAVTEEMPGAFTCIRMSNGFNNWMPVHGTWNAHYAPSANRNVYIGLNRMVTLKGRSITVVNASSFQPRLQPVHPALQLVLPPGDVKFSVIDQRFKNVSDTIIKYHKRNFIEVAQYSNFTKDNYNYLIVKEQFPSSGKGLLLLHIDQQGQLIPSPLRLYDRYHYSLPQMQQSGRGSVLIPYIYKGEVGMVNMSVETNG
jgi:hypothetical protein